MYREREDEQAFEAGSPYRCSAMASPAPGAEPRDTELEYYILGSWNKGKCLKHNGLMKKVRLVIPLLVFRRCTDKNADHLDGNREDDIPPYLVLLPFRCPLWPTANPLFHASPCFARDQSGGDSDSCVVSSGTFSGEKEEGASIAFVSC